MFPLHTQNTYFFLVLFIFFFQAGMWPQSIQGSRFLQTQKKRKKEEKEKKRIPTFSKQLSIGFCWKFKLLYCKLMIFLVRMVYKYSQTCEFTKTKYTYIQWYFHYFSRTWTYDWLAIITSSSSPHPTYMYRRVYAWWLPKDCLTSKGVTTLIAS